MRVPLELQVKRMGWLLTGSAVQVREAEDVGRAAVDRREGSRAGNVGGGGAAAAAAATTTTGGDGNGKAGEESDDDGLGLHFRDWGVKNLGGFDGLLMLALSGLETFEGWDEG
jgi:hypothetical protein